MAIDVGELDLPVAPVDPARSITQARSDLDTLRHQHWLAKVPFGYVMTHHDDCVAVLKDDRWHQASRLLTALKGVTDERYLARQERPSILTAEGEEHQRLRRLVSPAFTPRSADRLRPLMAEVIGEIFDSAVGGAAPGEIVEFEAVEQLCRPYPIPIICELLGAPRQDWPLFSRWADEIFQIFNDDLADHIDEVMAAQDEIDSYISNLIEHRRNDRGDDLLSELIGVEEQGDRLSHDELMMLASAVLLAGTDTTRNQLACALALFAESPSQWALLGDPATARGATEEALRHLGAVRGTVRFASTDIEYRDVRFPKGTIVFPSFVSANHDPSHFADPERFDVSAQRSTTHLTLGFGLHYCLGANLARAELQEALMVLHQRMPQFSLAAPVEWKPQGVGIWGPSRLPLSFKVPPS